MLEILILIALGKRIGAIVREKGRNAGWYQFMLVGFWFGGEVAGGIFGAVLAFVTHPELDEPPLGMLYIPALIGAALGAVSAFVIAKAVRPVEPAVLYDGREYDRGRGEWEGDRWTGRPAGQGEPHITERPAPPPRPDDHIRE